MKIAIFSAAIAMLLPAISHAGVCSELSGTWANKETETQELPTILRIEDNCTVSLLQTAPRHDSEPLKIDYLFKENGRFRVQMSIRAGAKGDDGNLIPPLSDQDKKKLQGNVYVVDQNSISFGLDFLDKMCGGEQKCPGAKFYRN